MNLVEVASPTNGRCGKLMEPGSTILPDRLGVFKGDPLPGPRRFMG
jgi:hypothetical protein